MNAELQTMLPFSANIPEEVRADVQAVMDSLRTGVPVDHAVKDRLRARSAEITQRTFEKFGLLDIGVPAIRELRGELPE